VQRVTVNSTCAVYYSEFNTYSVLQWIQHM